jgi:hypothetical protein
MRMDGAETARAAGQCTEQAEVRAPPEHPPAIRGRRPIQAEHRRCRTRPRGTCIAAATTAATAGGSWTRPPGGRRQGQAASPGPPPGPSRREKGARPARAHRGPHKPIWAPRAAHRRTIRSCAASTGAPHRATPSTPSPHRARPPVPSWEVSLQTAAPGAERD